MSEYKKRRDQRIATEETYLGTFNPLLQCLCPGIERFLDVVANPPFDDISQGTVEFFYGFVFGLGRVAIDFGENLDPFGPEKPCRVSFDNPHGPEC